MWLAPPSAPSEPADEELAWIDQFRVELETPGGPLPFIVETAMRSPPHRSKYLSHREFMSIYYAAARVVNGTEATLASSLSVKPTGLVADPETARSLVSIAFDQYESSLEGSAGPSCIVGDPVIDYCERGVWKIRHKDTVIEIPFVTRPASGADDRFNPVPDAGEPAGFTGRWSVDFSSTDDAAVGAFEVDTAQIASSTFLTPTGDYRYLAGRVDGDLMRLSTFDGAHAYLFHARMQPDGTISGDFWSGNWHHETWTAVRDDDARLPDPFAQTAPTAALVDDLVFRSLDGTPTRVADLLDAGGGKARIIEVFGSWCPNCADAGTEMRRLRDKYGDRLTIVGLAFERSSEHAEAAERVRAYADRFNADWPLLIGGLADKAKASAELPILDQVRAFPTTIFLNERNEVVRVHSGFVGLAGRGDHLKQQRAFETIIDELLAE